MYPIKKYIDLAIELEQIDQIGLSHVNDLRRNSKLAGKLRAIAKNIELKTRNTKGRSPNYLVILIQM